MMLELSIQLFYKIKKYMCTLDYQTAQLLTAPPVVPPPVVPPTFIIPLINSYVANGPDNLLDYNVYAEPYYGDYNSCSAVLLTHNPGQASINQKGIGSPFEVAITSPPNLVEENYYNISVNNIFSNAGTVRWVNGKNYEIKNLLNGITTFKKRLFIRDLIPYHGKMMGDLSFNICTGYLYNYFFPQVICSSFNSELYHFINRTKISKKGSILFARGSKWIEPKGLGSIGWDFIGRIYSNCYVFKANFDKINNIEDVNIQDWPCEVLSHDIYIVAITPKKGGRVMIYKKTNLETRDFNFSEITQNYDTIGDSRDPFFIEHSVGMDEFINVLRI